MDFRRMGAPGGMRQGGMQQGGMRQGGMQPGGMRQGGMQPGGMREDEMREGGMVRGFPEGFRHFPGRFPRRFPERFFLPFPIVIQPGYVPCYTYDRYGRCCDRYGRCCDRFGRCDFPFDYDGYVTASAMQDTSDSLLSDQDYSKTDDDY